MARVRSGPVRSEEARRAILAAAAAIFTEVGYDHLTMEGIAARAGVGKQTIYRWWPSKGAVIADCLLDGDLLTRELRLPDTGDVRHDLTEWLEAVFAVLQSAKGEQMVRSLIAAAAEHVEIGARLRASLMGTDSLEGRLSRARDVNPRLASPSHLELVVESLVGAVLLRALSRQPGERSDAVRLVDMVLGTSEEHARDSDAASPA